MPLIDEIRYLEEQGVLGREECPTEHYWHWYVLKPEALSGRLKENYAAYGEIRWHGER